MRRRAMRRPGPRLARAAFVDYAEIYEPCGGSVKCPKCDATGKVTVYDPGGPVGACGWNSPSSTIGECGTCRGTGAVTRRVENHPSRKEERKCYACGGKGTKSETTVTERYPSGKVAKTKQREVKCERCKGKGKWTEVIEARTIEHFEPDYKARKGGCFITTACALALDSAEAKRCLDRIRAFRDEYVAGRPYGPLLLDAYYEIAPLVVEAIDDSGDARPYESIFATMIVPCVELIDRGRSEDAVEHYARELGSLVARYAPGRAGEIERASRPMPMQRTLDGFVCFEGDNHGSLPSDLGSADLHVYRRDDELRRRVAALTGTDAAALMFGHGADDVFFRLASVLRALGRDSWLAFWPSYEPHMRLVAAAGGVIEQLDTGILGEDMKSVLRGIAGYTGAILLVNPGNPTGTVISSDTVLALASRNPEAIVVIDESFCWFSPNDSVARCVDSTRNLIVIQSTSKSLGTPGARLGWLVTSSEEVLSSWRRSFPPFFTGPDQVRALSWLAQNAVLWRRQLAEAVTRARGQDRLLCSSGLSTSASRSNLSYFVVSASVGANICAAATDLNLRLSISTESPELISYFSRLHAMGLVAIRLYSVPGMAPVDLRDLLLRAGVRLGSLGPRHGHE